MISITDCFEVLIGLLKIKYFRRLNSVPTPRVVAYTVTWRCNASCDMCGIKSVDRNLKDEKQELNTSDVYRIFRDPLLRKLDLIRFTGGEPFLKEDFIDIVEEIMKNTRTKIYYITTNGFYSQRIFDFVERLAPRTKNLVIQVSLDAPGEVHDNIRKLPGLYERIIYTFKGLKMLKHKYKFSFGVNQTITDKTASYLEEIRSLCQRFGCDHKIYLAHRTHESNILEGEKLGHQPLLISSSEKKDIENLYNRIEEHYHKLDCGKKAMFPSEILWSLVEKYILLGSKNRVVYGYAFPNPRCLAMFFYLRLLPDGLVMPCTLKPRPMGNLKEQRFNQIWNSPQAQAMRAEVRACPGCWVECDIVPNIVYSWDMLKGVFKQRISLRKK